MKRRRPAAEDAPGSTPRHLRVYDLRDWPNPRCHPECAFWEAVDQWYADHADDEDAPLELPVGPDVPWHPEWI